MWFYELFQIMNFKFLLYSQADVCVQKYPISIRETMTQLYDNGCKIYLNLKFYMVINSNNSIINYN